MPSQTASRQQAVQSSGKARVAEGFAVFAGVLMILSGVFEAVAGLVALVTNDFYVSTRNYVFQFDVTAWGWIHLLVGLAVGFAGIGVIRGQGWARVVGITLAGLSALANFMFIPYFGSWSLLIVALDVVVIWALAVYHPEP